MEKFRMQNDMSRSLSYDEYLQLVTDFASQGKTSGEQIAEKIQATVMNAQRMNRIGKQCVLESQLQELAMQITTPCTWIVIAETWCGDAAQCIPVIAKIAALSPFVQLKIIFRDENPKIMDRFLTNGARAIPKLIAIDTQTDEIMFIWGPRPKNIQDMVANFKKESPMASHEELVKNIHLWYARDHTHSIQSEFISLLKSIKI